MRAKWLAAAWCLVFPILSATAAEPALERGRYIVERVGLCTDCHSPRDARGKLIAAERLRGAPIGFRPLVEMSWADFAPPLAGLPQTYDEAQLAAFLQSGRRPDGSSPRPPMPPYRMTKGDAEAVVLYLKSLGRR